MSARIHHLGGTSDGMPRAVPLPLPPSEKALRAAKAAGYDEGERRGYVDGWRWGVVCGATVALPAGMGVMWALIELGRLLGSAP